MTDDKTAVEMLGRDVSLSEAFELGFAAGIEAAARIVWSDLSAEPIKGGREQIEYEIGAAIRRLKSQQRN